MTFRVNHLWFTCKPESGQKPLDLFKSLFYVLHMYRLLPIVLGVKPEQAVGLDIIGRLSLAYNQYDEAVACTCVMISSTVFSYTAQCSQVWQRHTGCIVVLLVAAFLLPNFLLVK